MRILPLILSVVGSSLVLGPSLVLAQSAAGEASCRQKWTYAGAGLNQRMFKNCVEEQRAAWTKLEDVKKAHLGQPWFERFVATGCVARWTNKDVVQPEMVAYCYQAEQQAFEDLKLGGASASFNAGGAEACFKVWRTDPGLVFAKTLECYRKRGEVPNFKLGPELQGLFRADAVTIPTPVAGTR